MPRPKKGETQDEKSAVKLMRRVNMQEPKELVEKIKMWLKGYGDDLSPTQLKTYYRIRKAMVFWEDGSSPKEIISALQKEFDIEERQAWVIWKQCQQLYGEVNKIDEEFLRNWQIEDLMKVIKLCEEENNIPSRIVAHRVLDMLRGSKEPKDQQMSIEPPKVIFITTDQDEIDKQLSQMPQVVIE
jgi:hypothetical protein